jgi:hypothetical protein
MIARIDWVEPDPGYTYVRHNAHNHGGADDNSTKVKTPISPITANLISVTAMRLPSYSTDETGLAHPRCCQTCRVCCLNRQQLRHVRSRKRTQAAEKHWRLSSNHFRQEGLSGPQQRHLWRGGQRRPLSLEQRPKHYQQPRNFQTQQQYAFATCIV